MVYIFKSFMMTVTSQTEVALNPVTLFMWFLGNNEVREKYLAGMWLCYSNFPSGESLLKGKINIQNANI